MKASTFPGWARTPAAHASGVRRAGYFLFQGLTVNWEPMSLSHSREPELLRWIELQMTITGRLPPTRRPLHPLHQLRKGASSPLWRGVSYLGREEPDASSVDLPDFDVTDVDQGAAAAAAVEESLRAGAPFQPVFLEKRMSPGIDRKQKARLKPHRQPVPISFYATASKIRGIS